MKYHLTQTTLQYNIQLVLLTEPYERRYIMVHHFTYVTSGGKVFITNALKSDTWKSISGINTFLFNGVKGTPTFHQNWVEIDSVPTKIEIVKPQFNIFYCLKEEFKHFKDKFPDKLSPSEAGQFPDGIIDELYNYHNERLDDVNEQVLFELHDAGEFVIKDPTNFSYEICGKFNTKSSIGREVIQHDTLSTLFVPSIVVNNIPCSISGEHLYDIIRQHIQENINHDVARITSDYNFCFEVQKVIKLNNPVTVFHGKGKKKQYTKTERLVSVFEMAPKAYQNYTPVPAISANNEEELKGKIDDIISNIMSHINKPEFECSCCNGRGTTDKQISVARPKFVHTPIYR